MLPLQHEEDEDYDEKLTDCATNFLSLQVYNANSEQQYV